MKYNKIILRCERSFNNIVHAILLLKLNSRYFNVSFIVEVNQLRKLIIVNCDIAV